MLHCFRLKIEATFDMNNCVLTIEVGMIKEPIMNHNEFDISMNGGSI